MSAPYTVRPLDDFTIFTTPSLQRRGVPFKASLSTTLADLEHELQMIDATDAVLELAVTPRDVRKDGTLRADARRPAHPGVRLSFQSPHGALSFTCDTYESRWAGQMPDWQANLRAIVLTLEALRAVERHGATKGQQYSGFAALPPGAGATPLGGMTRDEALMVLRIHSGLSIRETTDVMLRKAYKGARAAAHPDRKGGDRGAWDRVEQAGRVLGLDR